MRADSLAEEKTISEGALACGLRKTERKASCRNGLKTESAAIILAGNLCISQKPTRLELTHE